MTVYIVMSSAGAPIIAFNDKGPAEWFVKSKEGEGLTIREMPVFGRSETRPVLVQPTIPQKYVYPVIPAGTPINPYPRPSWAETNLPSFTVTCLGNQT